MARVGVCTKRLEQLQIQHRSHGIADQLGVQKEPTRRINSSRENSYRWLSAAAVHSHECIVDASLRTIPLLQIHECTAIDQHLRTTHVRAKLAA